MSSEHRSCEKKRLCREFADNWSVTGYRYVYYGVGVRRLIWLILLLAATAFAAYLFYGTIVEYLNYETYIVYNIDYSMEELTFPTITFCNLNPQNARKATARGSVTNLNEFKEIYSYLTNENSAQGNISYQKISRWMKRNNLTTFREALKNLEMGYNDMTEDSIAKKVQSDTCRFENRRCSLGDMRDTMSWDHSLCYQFNSYNRQGISQNSSTIGINGGLQMFLDLGSEESQMSTYPYNGMQIMINPFGIPHMLQKYDKSILVQPGTMNALSVDVIETTLLPEPYPTACGKGEFKIITDYPYSKAMCEVDCILQEIVSNCNCVGFEFTGFVGDVSVCSVKQMGCYLEWRNKLKDNVPQSCKNNCPRECTQISYRLRISQATLGNNNIFGKFAGSSGMNRSRAKEYITENIVGFKISFQSLYRQMATVTPAATWTNLLGEIGGNLGLCMGLSILTVFELIFFLFDYISVLFACWRRKTNDKPSVDELPID